MTQLFDINKIPILSEHEFRSQIVLSLLRDFRMSAFFVSQNSEHRKYLYAVLCRELSDEVIIFSTEAHENYDSMTLECPEMHLFEREIYEQWGIYPKGHPWLKPVRQNGTDFFKVEGEEIHEVGVGPVHAGIIEPGHFRFQCHGEWVHHLEIALGYQHRGIERELLKGINKKSFYLLETTAGDTTIGHAWAYCGIIEQLQGRDVAEKANLLRMVMLELERMANHVGDLGALSGDVGYLATSSFCGRIRGDFLNLSALICGSRFGRSFLVPGGVRYDLDNKGIGEFLKRFESAYRDARGAIDLLWESASVLARFENTGVVSDSKARDLGLVGPAARASGVNIDVRRDFDSKDIPIYSILQIPVLKSGDVFARARVRWLEVEQSYLLIKLCMQKMVGMDALPVHSNILNVAGGNEGIGSQILKPHQLAVSFVEGWRGEICHVAVTDAEGALQQYKIVDPSFHNWTGLAMALQEQEISDFPLCNKSFNLSYCGFDL